MLHARGNDKIIRRVLLQHEPLHLHIVFGMAPVPLGIQVTQVSTILQAENDSRQGPGNLSCNKSLAAHRRLMVEQNAVAGKDVIRLTIVDHDPVGIKLGNRIGRTRVERGLFRLGRLPHLAE